MKSLHSQEQAKYTGIYSRCMKYYEYYKMIIQIIFLRCCNASIRVRKNYTLRNKITRCQNCFKKDGHVSFYCVVEHDNRSCKLYVLVIFPSVVWVKDLSEMCLISLQGTSRGFVGVVFFFCCLFCFAGFVVVFYREQRDV